MINSNTSLYAVIGNPVRHSISPQIQNFLFNASGVDAVYTSLEVKQEHFHDDINFLMRHFAGFNITIPHKERIIPHLTEIDHHALMYGSVNTVKCHEGKLKGYSTDGDGFMRAMKYHGIELLGKRVLLTGAGGVSKVMAHESANEGAMVTIATRNEEKAKELALTVKQHIKGSEVNWVDINKIEGDFDVLLQGTPVGMHPHINDCPVSENVFANIPFIFDTIYNPTETMLIKESKKHGAKAFNGLMMLIFQAVRAQEIWTGHSFDHGVIEELTKMVQGLL